jgi:hypothetical protein
MAPPAVKVTGTPLHTTVLEGEMLKVGLGFVARNTFAVFTQVPSEAVTVYIVEIEGETTGLAPVKVGELGAVQVNVEAPPPCRVAFLLAQISVGVTIAKTLGSWFTVTVTC